MMMEFASGDIVVMAFHAIGLWNGKMKSSDEAIKVDCFSE